MSSRNLELNPLRDDQLRQVAEWDWGPQDDDVDWVRYANEMNAPAWTHFGLYLDGTFVGCVSFERTDAHTVEYHVTTARRKVKPRALATLLLATADYFFSNGITTLTASIPRTKRAAVRLAIRCGMTETSRDDSTINFILKKEQKEYGH